jgi:hypothetical protein
MAQDPLSHVASWLEKPTDVAATVDPIVAMKAEYDRLLVKINRITAPGYDGPDADSEASLVDQLCDLEAKVMEAVAISPAGLAAQIEVLRDCGNDYGVDGFNHLINRVRNIEALTGAGLWPTAQLAEPVKSLTKAGLELLIGAA